MTLGAVGELHPRRIRIAFAEGNQFRVLRVAQVNEAVTRIAVERDGRERVRLRVDGRRVTSGTVLCKDLFVPVGSFGLGQLAMDAAIGSGRSRRVGRRQQPELAVLSGPLEKTNFSPRAEQIGDTD